LLRQRHDGQHGKDADEDKDALHDAGRDVSEREDVILPLQERIHHESGADVRDDQEQLQERPPEDLVVGAAVRDVADGVVQDRLEEEKRRDRRDEGDEEQHPKGKRDPSGWAHADTPWVGSKHRRWSPRPVQMGDGLCVARETAS
jgi:hypothetical protein